MKRICFVWEELSSRGRIIAVLGIRKRKPLWGLLALLVAVTAGPITIAGAEEPVFRDQFDQGLDSTHWSYSTGGVGASAHVSDGVLEMKLQADANSGGGDGFGANVDGVCDLSGDFDVQVDFDLAEWDDSNGVRVGLTAVASPGSSQPFYALTERVGDYGSVYLTHFSSDGVNGLVHTTDRIGSLRLVRIGTIASAYFFDGTEWSLIHVGHLGDQPVRVGLHVWSHDYLFAHHETVVRFDNFQITQGLLVCRCGDATLLGVRGSGDNDHGDSYPGVHALEVAQRLQSQGVRLGTPNGGWIDGSGIDTNVLGIQYPAVPVWPPTYDTAAYDLSVNAGVAMLEARVRNIRNVCGLSHPVVVVGFSQGAHVVQSGLDRFDDLAQAGDAVGDSIVGAALLASPRFSPSDPVGRGTFVGGHMNGGIANPSLVRSRYASVERPVARSWCLNKDFVCDFWAGFINDIDQVHVHGYTDETEGGRAVLDDAAGLLRWGIRNHTISASPTGQLNAYRQDVLNNVRVSAAELYSSGAPTTSFAWDFTSDGTIDATSSVPWQLHGYGVSLLNPGSITTVTATYADGTTRSNVICISRSVSGSATC